MFSYPSASSSQISLNLGSEEQSTGSLRKDPSAQLSDNKLLQEKNDTPKGPTSRREWLREWQNSKPTPVLPCSAKAVYRLADSMISPMLSRTVTNMPT